jgi:hypothetical protein
MPNNKTTNITTGNTSVAMPNHLCGEQVTNAILHAINSATDTNDDDEPNAK